MLIAFKQAFISICRTVHLHQNSFPHHQSKELVPGPGILLEGSQHDTRHGFGVQLLHTSHHHAHVAEIKGEEESERQEPREANRMVVKLSCSSPFSIFGVAMSPFSLVYFHNKVRIVYSLLTNLKLK